jgi:hypothetical protein
MIKTKQELIDELNDLSNHYYTLSEYDTCHGIGVAVEYIMANLMHQETAKDKGIMLNINNYRMKLWCDMFIEYKKGGHDRQTSASSASKDLQMFDLQFNL